MSKLHCSYFTRLLVILPLLFATLTAMADREYFSHGYKVQDLVSNIPGKAGQTDPDLVNAWGIAFNPDGFVWVNDGGTGKSTLYDGNGVKQRLVVTVPGPSIGGAAKPTGIVFFGGGSDFIVKDRPKDANDKGAPSRFIFSTEDGTISGWSPAENLTRSIEVINNSASQAIYKGLALGADGNRYLLYATDFHNAKVDVFDGKFTPVTLDKWAFNDPKIPKGYAPFGIQAINGVIFVTYAKQDKDKEDDVAGQGMGYVNAYDASGHLLKRIAVGDKLNAPWGLALAPANFGRYSNHLLVGNFGDGTIVAYDLNRLYHNWGSYLREPNGKPVAIDGLWGINFGNGLKNQPTNSLFFTAGPNDEADGTYGKVEAISEHTVKDKKGIGPY